MNMTPQQCIDYCIQELERMFVGEVAPDQVAAIIVEPVQGEGGFMVAPPGFLGALKTVCEKYNILFVADEIQSDFLHTVRMVVIAHDHVAAALLISDKSISAGMPISAVATRAVISDAT